MPTKKPLSPTVEVMSDGENTFVVADGSRIAKRGGPGTPQAKTWISLEPGWNVFDDDGMLVVDMTASLCIEGFRAWVTDDRARLEKCNCDFGGCENAEVNPHYRLSERYWPGPAPHDADVSLLRLLCPLQPLWRRCQPPKQKDRRIDRRSFR